ncbi:MAG: FAD/NAD(P)-binding protein [Phycisphaerae bacterium]|nr:FAD/NAD(P)-binding protein [Phycisphaerae bacterium]
MDVRQQAQPVSHQRTIVIIGGGFSGSMTAYHLLRHANAARSAAFNILLIERNTRIGFGPAYATRCSEHLLNVAAGRMSALPDQPDHFLAWATQSGLALPGFNKDTFAPRPLYGAYVADLLAKEESSRTSASPTLERIHDEAAALDMTAEGYAVRTRSGRAIRANAVLLALGNAPPATPAWPGSEQLESWEKYVRDPWADGALRDITPDERIGIIGTGLTMFDAVLEITAAGHRGPIVAVSRRGLTPKPHHMRPPYIIPKIDLDRFKTLRGSMIEIRRLNREVTAAGGHWTQTMAALRGVTASIWASWSQRDRDRFLARLRTYWDMHRHRAAPQIADRIGATIRTGRLSVRGSKRLSWRRDGKSMVMETMGGPVICDRVINCTGPDTDVTRSNSPLVKNLLQSGLIVPDDHRLGIRTTERGETLDHAGKVSPRLLAIGGWLRPILWETTAVQELREQAVERAKALLSAAIRSG